MTKDGVEPKLWNTKQLAALFGVNPNTIRKWVHERRLEAKMLGTHFRFTTAHINKFIRGLPDAAAVVSRLKGATGGKKK